MNSDLSATVNVQQLTSIFRDDVYAGLSREKKSLPSKYFYDKRGSELFDQICELPEYYPTRTELAIMNHNAAAMGQHIGSEIMLVEFGSGSSLKTRLLLDELRDPAAYVPVDVSAEHLENTAIDLSVEYPHIEILPVAADFTQPFALPTPKCPARGKAVYFPGSTIGNFETEEASAILRQVRRLSGDGGELLIGIDLKKDTQTLEAAYNDSQGVTAAFNLNLLERANRELQANFNVDLFQHVAVYNEAAGRIEMYLESQEVQTVSITGQDFFFSQGERILTEYSHKYTVEQFSRLAAESGFVKTAEWLDDEQKFAVLHFVIQPAD